MPSFQSTTQQHSSHNTLMDSSRQAVRHIKNRRLATPHENWMKAFRAILITPSKTTGQAALSYQLKLLT